ncbi:MAG: RIP metalloprotease RseP [Flavobacteriales bacterium]|nr:RIP metalloprotease RseP [Flavobacteriales bacterium]
MEILNMVGQLILGLSILVILHELGHFVAARYFGIKVEKFYLFFDAWNKRLFKFRKGDTEYGVGWLPLGGYVKIAGMIDESMDTEQMKQPPQPWEFRTKPAWQRLIVMLGGIIVNAVLGVLIFWMLAFIYGETYLPNSEVKNGIFAYPIAQEIGFATGDKLVAVNGEPLVRFDEIRSPNVLLGDVRVTVLRDGKETDVYIPDDFMGKIADVGADKFLEPRQTFYVEEVAKNSHADEAGLQANDRITAVNDVTVPYFHEFQEALAANAGHAVNLKILRDGKEMSLKADVTEEGTLGFLPHSDFQMATQKFSFFGAFRKGMTRAWSTIADNARGFGKVLTGKVDASKSVQGPIGIMKIYGTVWRWERFWTITGLLSLVLAFMNLLPIPALDGGHVLFTLVEMIKGKPLSERFLERAQVFGAVVLLTLMVLIIGNDVWRLVFD